MSVLEAGVIALRSDLELQPEPGNGGLSLLNVLAFRVIGREMPIQRA